MNAFLNFNNVTFGFDATPEPLFTNVTLTFPTGWTGIAGANGCGKSTLLHLASGLIAPTTGRVLRPGTAVYCAQRTDTPPDRFDDFLDATDHEAGVLQRGLDVDPDWLSRWSTLSHGERKRAQIAVALWFDPDVLAIDEPTNHLDSAAREMLAQALRSFRGIGLLVSHDRELLDSLSSQTLLLRAGSLELQSGGYSTAMRRAEADDAALRDEYSRRKQNADRLAAEAARRRAEADRADGRRSKRHLALRDHDGRGKIDAAIVSGADGKAGRLARQLDGRVEHARTQLAAIQLTRKYDINFWLPDSRADRPILHHEPAGSTVMNPSEIENAHIRFLHFPDLVIDRGARIAITGVNGSGKSTLIRYLLGCFRLPDDRVIYLPQEIDAADSSAIMTEVNSLSRARLGQVMTIVSCLGSRPDRLVGNVDVSPGELRKVMLALGIIRNPWLIVMDEPTNHLDLPAVEALEDALANCPCALLLASHDARFLERLTSTEWRIESSRVKVRQMQGTNNY